MAYTRDDYLAVAMRHQNSIKNNIFNCHWNEVLKNRIWISNDGTEYKFENLDDSHLRSIIKMLVRFDDPSAESLIVELMRILIERNKF